MTATVLCRQSHAPVPSPFTVVSSRQSDIFPKRNRHSSSKIDFRTHVALVAVVQEDGQPVIVGGGRYIVAKPGSAEVAFAIIDEYQGQGIGGALLRHLVALAREAGLKELIAEVLPKTGRCSKYSRKVTLKPIINATAASFTSRFDCRRKRPSNLSEYRKCKSFYLSNVVGLPRWASM